VVLRLRVRRWFCGNHDCPAGTFAEQIAGWVGRRVPPVPRVHRGGGGIQSLLDNVRVQLELLDERRFGNGLVHLRYRTRT
jgi:hypothetical protein